MIKMGVNWCVSVFRTASCLQYHTFELNLARMDGINAAPHKISRCGKVIAMWWYRSVLSVAKSSGMCLCLFFLSSAVMPLLLSAGASSPIGYYPNPPLCITLELNVTCNTSPLSNCRPDSTTPASMRTSIDRVFGVCFSCVIIIIVLFSSIITHNSFSRVSLRQLAALPL